MLNPGFSVRLRSSARTDTGRVRQNNEDSIHLWAEEQYVLAVVADGMGGAVAGEEASRIAIETIHKKMADDEHQKPDAYSDVDEGILAEKLSEVVQEANQNIVNKANHSPELKGMGTTLTLAFARQTGLTLAHVGDSRAYQVDGQDGAITQLTADHSFVQALVDAGHITQTEAEHHPMKNVLYRALGQDSHIDIDIHQDLHMSIGDRLVLCSDGLTLHLSSDEIAEIVMEESDPNAASERLVKLANERGGRDNISVIVIVVESEDSSEELERAILFEPHPEDEDPTIRVKPTMYEDPIEPSDSSPKAEHPTPVYQEHYGEGRDIQEPHQ